MNIDKANATLAKAIVLIQEGDSESLRAQLIEGGGSNKKPGKLARAISSITTEVAEATGAKRKAVSETIEQIVTVNAAKALRRADRVTSVALAEWMTGQRKSIVAAAVKQLKG